MGPPAYADGDAGGRFARGGSTDALQWGRRPTPTETWIRTGRSSTAINGFNGAAGLRRRRLRVTGGAASTMAASMGPPAYADGDDPGGSLGDDVGTASMGPPAYADGDLAAAPTARSPPSCFNGAAGLRRRRPLRDGARCYGEAVLQWGRRPTPTE